MKVDDSRLVRLGFEKSQLAHIVHVTEQGLPFAENDWVYVERVFINQVQIHEG